MKKIKLILIILIIIIIAFFIIDLTNQDNIEETSSSEVVDLSRTIIKEIPVEWNGKFIRGSSVHNDTWTCFRKKINIENENFGEVIAQISADSQYWLYINGKEVVKQGGLKRGEEKDSIYYENINITQYLKKGENIIAILTWFWGDDGLSYVTSGTPGLFFQTQIEDNIIISDSTWKTIPNPAFIHDGNIPNYRLPEFHLFYNSITEISDWTELNFDDSNWEDAVVICNANEMPFGKLILRDIPAFKNYELKHYENSSQYIDYITVADEVLEMIIPYNAQFYPYLKVEAVENQKIVIDTDQYYDVNGDSLLTTYVTKNGIQEFESYSWINGEKVYYHLPAGIKIIDLGYIETGYDTEIVGNFKCDDDFFNSLWDKSARTLYVNMRDTYMDCPTRERAQWWGDTSIEMIESMYALDTKANCLYKKGVKSLINWQDLDLLFTVVPNSCWQTHIPIQMLLGIECMYEYYEYTGDKEFLQEIYNPIKKYLCLWEEDENTNLLYLTQKSYVWEWGDSAGGIDYKLLENMWYYLALNSVYKISGELGFIDDKNYYEVQISKLYNNLNSYWTDIGYKSNEVVVPDERVNAVAVISGLADKSKYEVISKILSTDYQSSPFMEKYILEALCLMDRYEVAQERIKSRYNEMVNGERACSTLWENWNYDIGTKNHAWSGGPLIIMSKYFAGIKPLEKGYETISIKPNFGTLSKIATSLISVRGVISLNAQKNENEVKLDINVPARALVAIEKVGDNSLIKVNNKIVYKNGKQKKKIAMFDHEDEKYLYFYFEKGQYDIESKVE